MDKLKIHNASDLKKAIEVLELQKNNQEEVLKVHFNEVAYKLRPANIIKETVAEVSESMDFKKNLANIALGIGAGFLTKKFVVGKKTGSLAKDLLGTAIEYGVANFIAKKSHDLTEASEKPKKSFLKKVLARL